MSSELGCTMGPKMLQNTLYIFSTHTLILGWYHITFPKFSVLKICWAERLLKFKCNLKKIWSPSVECLAVNDACLRYNLSMKMREKKKANNKKISLMLLFFTLQRIHDMYSITMEPNSLWSRTIDSCAKSMTQIN